MASLSADTLTLRRLFTYLFRMFLYLFINSFFIHFYFFIYLFLPSICKVFLFALQLQRVVTESIIMIPLRFVQLLRADVIRSGGKLQVRRPSVLGPLLGALHQRGCDPHPPC